MAMAEIQRTITRRLSRLPSRFPTLDLDDAQQVQHAALYVDTTPHMQLKLLGTDSLPPGGTCRKSEQYETEDSMLLSTQSK